MAWRVCVNVAVAWHCLPGPDASLIEGQGAVLDLLSPQRSVLRILAQMLARAGSVAGPALARTSELPHRRSRSPQDFAITKPPLRKFMIEGGGERTTLASGRG